jgi:hypothetical protein
MNVRFADKSLRYRVSRSELDALLTGRSLSLEVTLPRSHVFRTSVRPALLGGWQLESDPTGIWLSIPRHDLEALAADLPSKEGITHRFQNANGDLVLSFEVDIKQSRPADAI